MNEWSRRTKKMRLQRLALKNWRSYQDASVTLEPVSVLVGRNGAGKSSLASAIEFALTGKTRWTEGQGLDALIRAGAETAEIEIDMDLPGGTFRLVRSIPHALSGPKGKTLKEKQAALYEMIGVPESVVRAAFDGGRLVSDPARAGALLAQYFGLEFDEMTLYSVISDFAKKLGGDERVFRPILEQLCRGRQGGMELFDALEREARTRRTETGRLVQKYKAMVEQGAPPGASVGDVDEIRRELDAAQKEYGEKVQARTRAFMLAGELRSLLGEREGLRAALGDTVDRAAAEADLREAKEALERIGGEIALTKERREQVWRSCVDLESRERTLRQTIEKLADAGGVCPIAPDVVRCPVERAQWDSVVESLRAEAEDVHGKRQAALREVQEIDEALGRLQAEAEAVRERQETAANVLRMIDRLDEIERRIQEIGEVVVPEDDTEALRERIQDLTRRFEQAAAYRAQVEAWTMNHQMLDQYDREYRTWDLLVAALGPKGVRSEILAEKVGIVQEHLNEWLGALTGGAYGVEVHLTGGLEIRVTAQGRTTPVYLLSQSEQKRVGIVLQAVLANLSGLRWVLVDEADMLDPDNRAQLASLLIRLVQDGLIDQAIVLATEGDVEPRDPGIVGVGVYRIESGRINRL